VIDILKYKDEITNWAGFIMVISGGIALYLKEYFPTLAGICGSITLICGSMIGYFTGKAVEK